MAENTFLGLQPYTEADAYRFKGRTEESQDLFRLIVRNDYTVCYAESGEGKTSLLNAGVFPLLRQNMFFPIAITFTSDDYQLTPDSFDTIIDRCIKDSIAFYNENNKGTNIEYKLCSTDFQDTDCQSALQQELSKYSWWKLRNYKPQAMGLTFTPVFVFDQFEEVFNLPGSIVWTKKFFDWLEDVSSDSCPDEIVNEVRKIVGTNAAFPAIKEEKDFKAVFSLRKEFIGELDYWGMQKCFIPSLKDNRYCLKALTYEGAKKVMTQQQRFEESKVKQVLDYFVQQYSREPEKSIEENLPVIPALLLSVVCESWEKDIDFFAGEDINEIGQSLNMILERFYDEALSSITNELQESKSQSDSIREVIETAIFALVDSNGKRVRRKSSELSHFDFDAKYKEILSSNRIIKISKIDGEDYVEIVHDALCPIIAKRKELYLSAKAKKREEEKLKEQAKKNQKRMMLVGGILFLCIILLWTSSSYLSMKDKNNELRANNSRRLAAEAQLLTEKGDVYLAQLLLSEVTPKNGMSDVKEVELALRKATSCEFITICKDNSYSNCVNFSPDGKHLITGDLWGKGIIWDCLNGIRIAQLDSSSIYSASYSPNGKYIVTVIGNGSAGSYSPKKYNNILVWDAQTGQCVKTLLGHTGEVICAAFSRDGKQIISSSWDGTIRLWDVETAKCLRIFSSGKYCYVKVPLGDSIAKPFRSTCATISPDGNQVLSSFERGYIEIWNAKSGKLLRTQEVNWGSVNDLEYSSDGKLFSSACDSFVNIHDAATGNILNVLKGHTGSVLDASFSPDNHYIVTASSDSTVRIWDCRTGENTKTYYGKCIMGRASYSLSGKFIAISSTDKQVKLWNYQTYDSFDTKGKIEDAELNITAISNNGQFVATKYKNHNLMLWNIQTKKCIHILPQSFYTKTFKFSSDNRLLITTDYWNGRDNCKIKIWDLSTGQLHNTLDFSEYPCFQKNIRNSILMPDNQHVVVLNDSLISVFEIKSGKCIKNFRWYIMHSSGSEECLEINTDGKKIAFTSYFSYGITVCDLVTGTTKLINGHDITCVRFSNDGKLLLSASRDGCIKLWNAANGNIYASLEVEHPVRDATFSSDDKIITAACSDGFVRMFDVYTGRCIGVYQGNKGQMVYAITNISNNRIYGIAENGMVYNWTFPPLQQLIDETHERFKDRKLTPEERRKYYLE